VLSGNRNFEGRINPDVKMNYLASPPLVVAYALAGSMTSTCSTTRWARTRTATTSFMKDIWPSAPSRGGDREAISSDMFTSRLRRRVRR
jgi:aconitate hydratase